MVAGIIIGLVISLFILMVGCGVVKDFVEHEWVAVVVSIVLSVVCIVSGGVIGVSVDNSDLEQDICGFEAMKSTYEDALQNEALSGFERATIMNTVMEQNKLLARRQVSIDKWWNVGISAENKAALLALTPIE